MGYPNTSKGQTQESIRSLPPIGQTLGRVSMLYIKVGTASSFLHRVLRRVFRFIVSAGVISADMSKVRKP